MKALLKPQTVMSGSDSAAPSKGRSRSADGDLRGNDFTESPTLFRRLFESFTQGALVHGPPDGRIIAANAAAEDFLGLSEEALIGDVLCETWKTFDQDKRDHTRKDHPVALAVHRGRGFRGELIGIDHPEKDEVRWLKMDVVPQVPPDGDPPYWTFSFFTDVTEQRRAQNHLLESERTYRKLTELSPDAILVYLDGRFTFANPAAVELLGAGDPMKIIGKSPFDFLHPEDHQDVRDRMDQVFEQEKTSARVERRLRRLDGSTVIVEAVVGPGIWSGRRAVQVLLRDVTERKRMEEELIQAKEEAERQNQAKNRFLSVVSHELRTPLNGIIGYAELIEAEVLGSLNEIQRDHTLRIKDNAWHLCSIIADILTFTKTGRGSVEVRSAETRMDQIVRDVAGIMEHHARTAGVELRVRGADKPVPASTDPGKVRQILSNLVENAIKHTDDGLVEIGLEVWEEGIALSVRDDGPGIPPDRLEDIFEAFVQIDSSSTRSRGGTGIGLSVCRHLAHLLGGEVEVESTLGEGSTFTVALPRHFEADQQPT